LSTPAIETQIVKRPWWYKGGDGFTYDHTDSLVVNGITYKRYSYGRGSPARQPEGHFRAERGTPGVLCGNSNCLGAVFVLSYGDCSLSAKCAVCGLEDVVYDG